MTSLLLEMLFEPKSDQVKDACQGLNCPSCFFFSSNLQVVGSYNDSISEWQKYANCVYGTTYEAFFIAAIENGMKLF